MFNLDVTMLLIICYVFGILTAAAIYLMIITPLEKRRYQRGYHAGFMDGINYAERANDHDY